jgi:hypothetical protein
MAQPLLVVAIFAAAAAALGNAGVTLVNGVLQRDLENTKSDAELRIEESKAESGRILEMIKTQDTEQAANNLRFLLDTALVVDPKRAEKLRAYLLTRPTPLLPPALQGPPRALEPFNVRENRDLAGQDLQNFPGSDINNCASECDGNSSCAAFAYDHFSRRCFLKSSVAGSLLRPGSTIGIKKPASIPPVSSAPVVFEMRHNSRVVDHPNTRKTAANLAACTGVCKDDPTCVGFSFLKNAQNEMG